MPDRRSILVAIIASAALVSVLGALVFRTGLLLAASSVGTDGAVESLDRGDHQRIHYSYEVAGARYRGTGRDSALTVPFDQLEPGEAVPVFYLAGAPQVSSLGDPRRLLLNDAAVVGLFALLAPPFLGLATWAKRRRRGAGA